MHHNNRTIDVAFITCADYPAMSDDDLVFIHKFKTLFPQRTIEFVTWTNFFEGSDGTGGDDSQSPLAKTREYFSNVKLVVLRSVWDYHPKHKQFMDWLTAVDESAACVLNSREAIVWNSNKMYLKELRDVTGVSIVPSYFMELDKEQLDSAHLRSVCEENGWSDIILKPCISAGSFGVEKLKMEDLIDQNELLTSILNSGKPYVMQPFVSSILKHGEYSLLFFNGTFSHAKQKTLKPGTFTWSSHEDVTPDQSAMILAQKVLDSAIELIPVKKNNEVTCSNYPLLYARVDLLVDENGNYMLGELEIFEPLLYFTDLEEEDQTKAAELMANTIQSWLNNIDNHNP